MEVSEDGFVLVRRLLEMQEALLAPGVTTAEAIHQVCRAALELTGADGAALEWHDTNTDELVYRDAVGSLASFVGLRLPRSGSLSGTALATKSVQCCEDSETDARVNRDACRRVGARSMVVVPLATEGQVAAVLKVSWPEPNAYSASAVDLLRMLAGFLAVGITRAMATDERAALDRYREEMAALVVHDLKSPLTAVVANIEFMRDELPRARVDALEAAGDALAAATRLSSMIGTLLDTARLEQRQLTLAATLIHPRGLVKAVFSERTRQAIARGVDLQNRIDQSAVVRADDALLRRMLENLIDTAIRHTPRGGRVEANAMKRPHTLALSVATTGPAIDEAERERLFEKYGRPGESETSTSKVGLGLHFCRLAAEAHGGRVDIESSDGYPTVFVVELPLKRAS